MLLDGTIKNAGVLLLTFATPLYAALNIDSSCTAAQRARLNSAFLIVKDVAYKARLRVNAMNHFIMGAPLQNNITPREIDRVNRLLSALFAVGPGDVNYNNALANIDRKPTTQYPAYPYAVSKTCPL